MATGDLVNNLDKVVREVRNLGIEENELDVAGLQVGDPKALMKVMEVALLQQSVYLARFLLHEGYTFFLEVPQQFLEVVYRISRAEFSYNPPLSEIQFMKHGHFVESKLIFLYDLMRLAVRKAQELEIVERQDKKHKGVSGTKSIKYFRNTVGKKSSAEEEPHNTVYTPIQLGRKSIDLRLQTSIASNYSADRTRTPNSSAPMSPVSVTSAASAPAAGHTRQFPIRATPDMASKSRSARGDVAAKEVSFIVNTNKAMECWVNASPQKTSSKKDKLLNKHLSPRPRQFGQHQSISLSSEASCKQSISEFEPNGETTSNSVKSSRSSDDIHRKLDLSSPGFQQEGSKEAPKNDMEHIIALLSGIEGRLERLETSVKVMPTCSEFSKTQERLSQLETLISTHKKSGEQISNVACHNDSLDSESIGTFIADIEAKFKGSQDLLGNREY